MTWTERRAPQQQEALIGVMFILAACAGILLLASNPHGGEHLKDLLVGQILWVNTDAVAVACRRLGAAAGRACGWAGCSASGRFGFYGAFALAVTASVQLVGVYLVFASLIIPALATRAYRGPWRYVFAYIWRAWLRARTRVVGTVRPPVRRGDRLDLGGLRPGWRVCDAIGHCAGMMRPLAANAVDKR